MRYGALALTVGALLAAGSAIAQTSKEIDGWTVSEGGSSCKMERNFAGKGRVTLWYTLIAPLDEPRTASLALKIDDADVPSDRMLSLQFGPIRYNNVRYHKYSFEDPTSGVVLFVSDRDATAVANALGAAKSINLTDMASGQTYLALAGGGQQGALETVRQCVAKMLR